MEWLLTLYFTAYDHQEMIMDRYATKQECVKVAQTINVLRGKDRKDSSGKYDYLYECIEVEKDD